MEDRRRFLVPVALALVVALGLGGCARQGPPAPVVQGHGEATSVVVQRGDSLYSIARRSSVPVRALIDANRLQAPYTLQVGQTLILPRVRTHTVQSGETLSGIARRHSVSTSALVAANRIEAPYVIKTGQILTLPDTVATETQAAAPAPTPVQGAPAAAAPVEPTPPPATPAPEARPSEIQQAALPPPPTARPPAPTIRPGAAEPPAGAVERPELSPPPAAAPAPPAAPPAAAAPAVPPPSPPPAAAVPPPAPARPAPEPARPAPEAQEEARGAVPEPPPRAGRLFLWPVRGSVISDFGSKPGGLQNDGINIAAAEGTTIRAAENGVVVYAGNELRGFGNLLLIRHSGGWMTTYAHASELLVRRSQEVKRGQPIAKVGSSGNVTSPQLHFEIRRGTRAVNPREYLSDEGIRTVSGN